MDAVRLSSLGMLALLNPGASGSSPWPADPASAGAAPQAPASTQDLFQQLLQASIPAGAQGIAALDLNAAPSLLAALTAPQATSAAGTTTTAPQVLGVAEAAAPVSVALAASPPVLPDATGSGLDFALQTALRFGAGVGPLAVPANAVPDLSTGLVRDAAAVLRNAPLQSQAGGPGTEAFVHSPFVHQALRLYQAGAIPSPTSSGLDLLA